MSQQLVLSIDNSAPEHFCWCWLNDGLAQDEASGNLEALQAVIGQVSLQAWLLLPGAKVVTRELEYGEKEKKHLRSLLPFQLEESVVGDIDELHVALGNAANGKVALAYTDKSWLKAIFAQLASIGVEITRCWSAPLLLPLQTDVAPVEPLLGEDETLEGLTGKPATTWVLAAAQGVVNIRHGEQQGFSVPHALVCTALTLLVDEQKLQNNLPRLVLRANSQSELDSLLSALPDNLAVCVQAQTLADPWQLDFTGSAIDLCQAEFSQRLPLERWWKLWRSIGILALVTLLVYVGVLVFHIHKLNKQNLQLRQQMEAVYRSVVPHGQSDDPEKRLRIKLKDLTPKNQTDSVVSLMAGVMPLIAANSDVTVKVISYSADTGEMSINVQAHSFNSIDSLRQAIAGQGYTAELLTANAQGDLNTGRLKITKPAH